MEMVLGIMEGKSWGGFVLDTILDPSVIDRIVQHLEYFGVYQVLGVTSICLCLLDKIVRYQKPRSKYIIPTATSAAINQSSGRKKIGSGLVVLKVLKVKPQCWDLILKC